jgi:HD-like signal output (HDOD) protein
VWHWRRRASSPEAAAAGPATSGSASSSSLADEIGYTTGAIRNAIADTYKLAFGVARFDYQIMGEHAAVLERIAASIDESVHQREYFPRRPMLLPKLLQALNDDDSTRQDLVRLILEDPSLAGSVLQRANSAFYRLAPEPVESLDRAVLLLGTDGLRSLMAVAILQPVFRLPKGYFDKFAAITWEQAQRAAVAAETYAKSTNSGDPFVAQLLGLLSALARIVLFRLTVDMYRERPNLLPRAEVFIRAMQEHAPRAAKLIASTWELSDLSLRALEEQSEQTPPARMSPLGRAVYYAELCGTLAALQRRDAYSIDGAHAMLIEQGLPREVTYTMWHQAIAVEQES